VESVATAEQLTTGRAGGRVPRPRSPELDRDAHDQPRPTGRGPSRARQDFFRLLTLVPVAIFVFRSANLAAPWAFVWSPAEPDPEPHRWFYAFSAATDLFVLASAAVVMARLRRPLLLAAVALSLAVVLVTVVPFQPGQLFFAIWIVPAMLVYPYWSDLGRLRTAWAGARKWVLALCGAVGLTLLVLAGVALRHQLVRDGEVADAHLWSGYAGHLAVAAVVSVLAAGTATGALLLRALVGAVAVYLGAVAVWVLPDAAGSWRVAGGLVAAAVGIVLLVSAWWDRRHPPARRRAAD
jgi:hypothetical protein